MKEIRLRLSPVKQKLLGDDWSQMITDLVRREGLDQAVLFGDRSKDRCQRALRRGLDLNASLPALTEVPSAASLPGTVRSVLPDTNGHRVLAFVADPAAAASAADFLAGCALIIVNNTTGADGYRLLAELSAESRLVLLAHDPLQGKIIFGGTGLPSSRDAGPSSPQGAGHAENLVPQAARGTE